MDNSHVALVSVMLKASGFENYRCDRSMPLGINVRPLSALLSSRAILPARAEREKGRVADAHPVSPPIGLAACLIDQDPQVRQRLGHCHAQGCR